MFDSFTCPPVEAPQQTLNALGKVDEPVPGMEGFDPERRSVRHLSGDKSTGEGSASGSQVHSTPGGNAVSANISSQDDQSDEEDGDLTKNLVDITQ
jgi:hypothetical protein